jgi:hypothetical protein
MPIKPLFPTEQDLLRARHMVRSLAPLRRLSCDDAEFVARAIAEIRTEGRAQGLEIAKDLLEHKRPDADTTAATSTTYGAMGLEQTAASTRRISSFLK